MNQKAFAIFVGAIMIISAFAGFVLRGNNQTSPIPVTGDSLQTFGVQGNLVDWKFSNLADMLEMTPNSTVMAYWINLTAPGNITGVARAVLPQSLGLAYGGQLYPTKIERIGEAYFNNTWVEFHWIRPFRVSYSGLVVPYENYMMIPASADYVTVMGRPTLFGNQEGIKEVLDVLSGGLPTDKFTLPEGENADLQIASLGNGQAGSLLKGGYKEFYLGLNSPYEQENGTYNITVKYLQPDASTSTKANQIAEKYGLAYSTSGSESDISGTVEPNNLQAVLETFLQP